MDILWQDIRFAARMLLKRPGFTAIAILALALGSGANTAVFSVTNAVLLRALPYENPERLVQVWQTNPQRGLFFLPVSVANFIDWRNENTVFEKVAAFRRATYNLTGTGEPEQLEGAQVTPNLFSVIGVNPTLGWPFNEDDDKPESTPVIVISDGLWHRRFGGDSGILGQVIQLNGQSYVVTGIMPPNFELRLKQVDVWVPLVYRKDDLARRDLQTLQVVALLKPTVKLMGAQSEMESIANALAEKFPSTNAGRGVQVISLREQILGNVQPALLTLLVAVTFVLLIACANVASMQLARATARKKEFALRASLGASQFRTLRQLMTESVLLCLLGGAAGLAIATSGVNLLIASSPDILPRMSNIHLDLTVLGYTLLVSMVAGVLSGLAPAMQIWHSNLSQALKETGAGLASGRNRLRMHRLLVICEVALAVMLLIGSGLMIKGFLRLSSVTPGFKPDGVLTMQLALSASKYPQAVQQRLFYDKLSQEIDALPGLQSSGLVSNLPFGGRYNLLSVLIENRPVAPEEKLYAQHYAVSPGYFQTLSIPLLKGRSFYEQDTADSARVVVISDMMARQYWSGDESPLGRRIQIPLLGPDLREVVGIVGDVRHTGLDTEVGPSMYTPYPQTPMSSLAIVSRGTSTPEELTSPIRKVVRAVDKDMAVFKIKTMDHLLGESISQPRFYMLLLIIFAGLAMVLAASGIYGVISYSVTQRSHDIGIRLAVGAQKRDIMKMILSYGFFMSSIGVIIGLCAALALARFVSHLLQGFGQIDPLICLASALLLSVIASLASYIPARRATMLDPLVVMRNE